MYQRIHTPSPTKDEKVDDRASSAPNHMSTGLGNAEMQRRMSSVQVSQDFASQPSTHHLGYKTSGWGTNRKDPEYARGALFDATGKWSAQTILSNLTQLDVDSETLADGQRCAAVSMLAVHIMGGPAAVAKVAQDVSVQMKEQMRRRGQGQIPPEVRSAMRTMRPTIEQLPQLLSDKVATYEQLHRLAECIKLVVDKDTKSGTANNEYKKMMRLGSADARYLGRKQSGMAAADNLVQQLQETGTESAYVLAIGTDDKQPDQTNHAVTLGVNASGQVYLYDPWPRVGKQLLMWSADYEQIRLYFETTAGVDRGWVLEVRMNDATKAQTPNATA